jgi:hypothetical protein
LRPKELREDDLLYQAALAVEADLELSAEMADWEEATLGDGLTAPSQRKNLE